MIGKDRFIDPALLGGGFHESCNEGFLDMHADFNMHRLQPTWLRTLNIPVYLNTDWKEENDGRHMVEVREDDEPVGVAPLFNHGLLTIADDHWLNGFKKMSLPSGYRAQVHCNSFELVPEGSLQTRTIGWSQTRTIGWSPEEGGTLKK